jgi:hypothetical protein
MHGLTDTTSRPQHTRHACITKLDQKPLETQACTSDWEPPCSHDSVPKALQLQVLCLWRIYMA